jgi:hypothetical protein
MIDLERFCMKNPEMPEWMDKPFRAHGKTWAANGFMIVGVPEDLAYDKNKDGTEAVSYLLGNSGEGREWYKMPSFEIEKCDKCGDDGWCEWCSGTGINPLPLVVVGIVGFTAGALNMIAGLDNVEICPNGRYSPARIRFTGGIGYIMPGVED